MDNQEQLNAAFDEWMSGQWIGIRAGELKPGMKMRDAEGGIAEISSIYTSADDCVFVNAIGRWGAHIPRQKIVLVLP